jgi:hypothetical protein
VKRSGRDEPMGIVTLMCMEVKLRISEQPSFTKTSKITMSFSLSHVFSSTELENNRVQQVLPVIWCGEGLGLCAKHCIHM